MHHTKHLCIFFIAALLLSQANASGQAAADIAVGQWRHHLPNHNVIKVEETNTHIIGATPFSLLLFKKADNSIERINKVHGLSDFDISTIAWSGSHETLIVGYDNGNIDIIKNNSFYNLTDILQASILGSKRINSIVVDGDRALLACNFGVVDLSLSDMLIYDTWYIGPFGSIVAVHDVLFAGDMIYAATDAGLMAASIDASNLADYRNWETINVNKQENAVFNKLALHNNMVFVNQAEDDSADQIYFFAQGIWNEFTLPGNEGIETTRSLRASRDHLIISHDNTISVFNDKMELHERVTSYYSGSVRAHDAIYDNRQKLWIGDRYYGLVRQHGSQSFEKIILPGPDYENAFGLAAGGGRLWVAPGAIAYNGANSWNRNGIFLFDQGSWKRFSRAEFSELSDVADIIRVAVDPNNHDRAYASSWYGGLIELNPDGIVELYDETNSTLSKRTEHNDRLRVGGAAVDRQGNLWVTNSEVERPLSVRKPDGEWMSFTNGGTFPLNTRVRDVVIDNGGQKWVMLAGEGIFVFKEQNLDNTNNFEARRLSMQPNNGGLPSNNVHSLAVDHNGYVWVGTDEGVAVFYSPHQALIGDSFNAQRIIVEQDDGFAGYLLETEVVNCIEVDGSNKKWFGTTRSGAFLLSTDGRETIFHFDKNNSPLPSNNILDITINGQNGEVFFATDRGLVSFRGLATEATARHSNVYAYPNPVRPGYSGYISVKGLVRNANVKITDINGNLVWETIAEGGQAIWNGQDLFGRRPSTGVYLVFSTNDDGEETMVTKIMFIN